MRVTSLERAGLQTSDPTHRLQGRTFQSVLQRLASRPHRLIAHLQAQPPSAGLPDSLRSPCPRCRQSMWPFRTRGIPLSAVRSGAVGSAQNAISTSFYINDGSFYSHATEGKSSGHLQGQYIPECVPPEQGIEVLRGLQ